ncbi:hypothetical protein M077_1100 [Bacteroides fragilis str. 2-F-2 |nr:hypothetical protein M077_1100 [Bacteroides fragilis str. 2-F-2 \
MQQQKAKEKQTKHTIQTLIKPLFSKIKNSFLLYILFSLQIEIIKQHS